MKKIIILFCAIGLILSCSNKDKQLSSQRNNLNQTNVSLNGIWLDTDKNGEIKSSHFIVIETIKDNALIIDFQINKKEIIKNSFYASYSENKIEWSASPLSIRYEYIKGSGVNEKPSSFNNEDSLLRVTQQVSVPEAGVNESHSGYYKKVTSENIQSLLEALKN